MYLLFNQKVLKKLLQIKKPKYVYFYLWLLHRLMKHNLLFRVGYFQTVFRAQKCFNVNAFFQFERDPYEVKVTSIGRICFTSP